MSSHTLGLILAVTSAISLGISTSLYKRSSEVLSPITTTFYYYVFSAILATAVWLFFGESKANSTSDLIWPLLIAVFLFISVLTFNFAIIHLSVSMGATIRALSFIVTVLIGVACFREQLAWPQGLAVILSLAAIVLAGMGGTAES